MGGGGQSTSRATVPQVEADLAAAREEIATVPQVEADLAAAREEIAGLRAELAELREQVGDIAVAVAPRLARLARRRAAAADE